MNNIELPLVEVSDRSIRIDGRELQGVKDFRMSREADSLYEVTITFWTDKLRLKDIET